jgi:hypothetical protein
MSVVLVLNIQPPRLVSRDEHGLEAFFLCLHFYVMLLVTFTLSVEHAFCYLQMQFELNKGC